MNDQIFMFYEKFVKTDEYKQSPVERKYDEEYNKSASSVLTREQYAEIEEDIFRLAEEAEEFGFSNGFRMGVLFMSGILKDDATA